MNRSVHIPLEDINLPTFDVLVRVSRAIGSAPDRTITKETFIAATEEPAIVADTFIEILSAMGAIAQTTDGRLTYGIRFAEFATGCSEGQS